MKIKDLREKNIEELKKLLAEKEENIRKFRFDLVTKQVKGTRQIRTEKRDVARMITLIREKNKQV
ncbi:MAG: 50S ribosomal protein L29 [Candidatus Moraniibacteriota bacterium]|jgi:large subunit ribosomal protein L29